MRKDIHINVDEAYGYISSSRVAAAYNVNPESLLVQCLREQSCATFNQAANVAMIKYSHVLKDGIDITPFIIYEIMKIQKIVK